MDCDASVQLGLGDELDPRLDPGVDLALLQRADAACSDLERRWQAGESPEVDDYLSGATEPELRVLLRELLATELEYRWRRGETPGPERYLIRFPRHGGIVRLVFDEVERTLAPQPARLGEPTDPFEFVELAAQWTVGQTIDDFLLLSELGAGAFARVFLARQNSLQRLVALKISADRGHEPQTLSQLDHPHIVRVFDSRRAPRPGLRLLYMEYLPGGTLAQVVAAARDTAPPDRSGALISRSVAAALRRAGMEGLASVGRWDGLDWDQTVCELGVCLARALEHAHRLQVLHRDVKPANVLLAADGTPKLADFNVSFCGLLEGESPLAYFGGSLDYMSPEQLRACVGEEDPQALDGRADLYSLAAVLWELLETRRPFPSVTASRQNWNDVVHDLLRGRAAPPSPTGASGVAAALRRVLAQTLSPHRGDRPASAAKLARLLLICRDERVHWILELTEYLGRPSSDGGGREREQEQPTPAARRGPQAPPPTPAERTGARRVFLGMVVPNIIGATVNLFYNVTWLRLHVPAAEPPFWLAVGILNLLLFPLGVLAVLRHIGPLRRVFVARREGRSVEAADVTRTRRGVLDLGRFGANLSIRLWALAGVAYPTLLTWLAPEFPWRQAFPLFLVSLVSGGLCAAAYPYFAVTRRSLRLAYPLLLDLPHVPPDEPEWLRGASSVAGRFLLLAIGVPLTLIIATLALWDVVARMVLVGVAMAGFLGLVLLWRAHRELQEDLESLASVIDRFFQR